MRISILKNIFLCIFTDLALSYQTPIDLSAPSSNFSLLLVFVSSLSSLPLLFCHVCVCVCTPELHLVVILFPVFLFLFFNLLERACLHSACSNTKYCRGVEGKTREHTGKMEFVSVCCYIMSTNKTFCLFLYPATYHDRLTAFLR